MEYFLLYIIISTVITLVSILFAYKPDEEVEVKKNKRVSLKEIKGKQETRNPVYSRSDKNKKEKKANGFGASLLSY